MSTESNGSVPDDLPEILDEDQLIELGISPERIRNLPWRSLDGRPCCPRTDLQKLLAEDAQGDGQT